MDIASKVLVWGAGGVLAGGIALLAFQSFLILPYLDHLEVQVAEDKAAQVQNLFDSEALTFSRTVEDWAFWGESARFVQGLNPSFETENFYPSAFSTIRVDSIAYFRTDGTVFWSRQRGPSGTLDPVVNLPFYQGVSDRLRAVGIGDGKQGYLRTPEGLVLAAFKLVRSEKTPDQAVGSLLMVRKLNSGFWQSFEDRMGLAVSPAAPEPGLAQETGASITPSPDRSFTSLRIPLADLTGAYSMELTARLPRTLTLTGMGLLAQVSWGSIVILLLTTLANLVLIRLVLVHPVKDLWRLTREVESSGNWSLRAVSRSKDEVGELAQGVNALISSVEEKTSRLEFLAASDALTSLANRRTFDSVLVQAGKVCRREGRPLGFIMGDVDMFKRFNDRYGHRTGDVCLKAVAHVIQDSAQRPEDVSARYGGEEFAVILPGTDLPGTLAVAERIRSQVESLGLPHEDNPGGVVTISLGCFSVVPSEGWTPDSLIEEADVRLYQAKAEGRNRVKS